MSTPKTTSHTTEIRNHQALANIAQKLQPVIIAPENPPPPPDSDFFQRLNMASKIETNAGLEFIIDVQPDLRFILYYSIYNVIKKYPSLDVKTHPYVSPFTLIAYDQTLIIAHLLLQDIHHRSICSHYANAFRRDNGTKDFLTRLTECIVPSHLEPILLQLISLYDSSRPNQTFIPDLAAFSWSHDFGRIVPPAIMLAAHNLIAGLRQQLTPDEILAHFYATEVCQVANVHYSVANLLGGWYRLDNADRMHVNWLNQAVEEIFNPVVGRALTNRPSLARIRTTPVVYAEVPAVNPYALLFGYSDDNTMPLTAMLENLSDFHRTSNSGKKTLLQLSGESTGITILSHSLEPPTLPTWHRLPACAGHAPNNRTHQQFADDINFMQTKAIGQAQLPIPNAGQCLAVLALVEREDCTAANDPFPALRFSNPENVYPPVLFFQPYNKSLSTLNYTVILGFKIESAEIDGVTLPVPNVRDSLIDNNSRYRQGSLPVSVVYPLYPRRRCSTHHLAESPPQ